MPLLYLEDITSPVKLEMKGQMCSDCAFFDNDKMLVIRLVFRKNNRKLTFLLLYIIHRIDKYVTIRVRD